MPDRAAVGTEHPAGNQLQDELLATDDDSVPGVMPARVARYDGKLLRKHIDNLALTFVAPLCAENYRCLWSHEFQCLIELAHLP